MRRRLKTLAVVLAGLTAAVGSVAWIWWAGPVVIVRVTTTDATGAVIPAVGDEVQLMSNDGLVWSLTNSDGKVAFWFIESRSRWVPSVGPDNYPWRSMYSIVLRPSLQEDLVCPSYHEQRQRKFAKWFWQRADVSRPTYGILSVDLQGIAANATRDFVSIESEGSFQNVNVPYANAICVRANQTLRVSLVIDSETVHSWPEFVAKAYDTTNLTVPISDTENDS